MEISSCWTLWRARERKLGGESKVSFRAPERIGNEGRPRCTFLSVECYACRILGSEREASRKRDRLEGN